MPINPLQQDEEDKKKTEGAIPDATQISSGESANVSGGQSQGPVAAPTAQPGSGSFTNLNQYVEANKDQGAGLGSKLAQNVQQTANQGLSSLGASQQEFSKAQQAAGVNPNDFTTEKITQTAQKALDNPSDIGQSDIDAFNQARAKSAAFTAGSDVAPKDIQELTSYQGAVSQLQGAQDKANLTGTESGRETLLRDTFKRPDYTKGQSALDQLFTQNVPENRQKFESLRQNLLGQYGLSGQENQAIQNAAQQRQQAITGTQQAAQNIQNTLLGPDNKGGLVGGYESQLEAKPGQVQSDQQQNLKTAQDIVRQYINNQYGSTWGLDPNQLVNSVVSPTAAGQATLQNTLSQQDVAKLNALNALAGRQANTLGTETLGPLDTTSYDSSANFDYGKGRQLIEQRQNALKTDTASLANQGLSATIPDVYGKSLGGSQAVDYAISRIDNTMNNPKYDIQENVKVQNALQSQINAINAQRAKYGMPQITINQNDLRTEVANQWNRVFPPSMNNAAFGPNGHQRAKRENDNSQFGQDFKRAIATAASTQYLANQLKSLVNNPLQNTLSDKTFGQNAPTSYAYTAPAAKSAPMPVEGGGGITIKPLNKGML